MRSTPIHSNRRPLAACPVHAAYPPPLRLPCYAAANPMPTALEPHAPGIYPNGDVYWSRNGIIEVRLDSAVRLDRLCCPVYVSRCESVMTVQSMRTYIHGASGVRRLLRMQHGLFVRVKQPSLWLCFSLPVRGQQQVACNFKGLSAYPFGQITCELEFGSWSYSPRFLDMQVRTASMYCQHVLRGMSCTHYQAAVGLLLWLHHAPL